MAAARVNRFGIGGDESVAVLGMKGTGKTTLCGALALDMPPVVAWDPFGQYPPPVQSYRPTTMHRREFDRLAAHLWGLAQQGRPSTFLVEEAEQVLPQGPDLPPAYKMHALMGRNLGLRSIWNTRRPQGLSKHVFNLADHLFIFKLEGGDLDWTAKHLGGTAGRHLRRMRGWIKDPREGGGRFFHYHDGELQEHDPLPRPKPARVARGPPRPTGRG